MKESSVQLGAPYGDLLSFPDTTPSRADVVVVGGGIVGVSTARELAAAGMRVVLVEKGQIASEQSGRNWGFVRQQGRDPLELPLAMLANRIWRGLPGELGEDIGWKEGGNLALASDPTKAAAYQEWVAMANACGLKSELITMSRVRELLPGVHGSWSLALHTASDGHANPVLATSALARSAVKNGAVLVTGSTVEEIEVSGGAVAGVRTSQGYIRTSTVVLAAGIWSSRIAGRLGVRLPQGIVTNSVAATQPVPRLTDLGVWTRELSFRQLSDGRLLLSAETATEVDVFLNEPMNAWMFMPVYLHNRRTFKMQFHRVGTLRRRRGMRHFRLPEARPNLAQLSSVASAMRRAFPQLADLRLERAWAGHIDGTPDGLAMIGRTDEVDGLVVATGFTGHGFALGPAAGRLVAGLLTGEDMGLDIDQFRPGRFRDGVRSAPRSLL